MSPLPFGRKAREERERLALEEAERTRIKEEQRKKQEEQAQQQRAAAEAEERRIAAEEAEKRRAAAEEAARQRAIAEELERKKREEQEKQRRLEKAMHTGEIKFRELPWGIPAKLAAPLLPDLFKAPHILVPVYSVESLQYAGHFDNSAKFANKGLAMWMRAYDKDIGLAVASHTTNEAEVYFAYVPENGKIIYDAEHTAMYAANYHFENRVKVSDYGSHKKTESEAKKEAEEKTKYFLEKLTLLYGEPDKKESLSLPIRGYNRDRNKHSCVAYHWYGANDTEVVLTIDVNTEYLPEVDGDVYISYIWSKGNELLKTADEAADPSSMIYKRLVQGAEWL